MGLDGSNAGNGGGAGLVSGADIDAEIKALEEMVAAQATKDLTLAAANGTTLEAVWAMEQGADLDSAVNSYTPLMRATNWGHVDIVAALIAEGADMFATDRRRRTALDWARIARQDKVARVLERAMENDIRYRRESTRAGRDKKRLWSAIHANARYAREIVAAVEGRDVSEVKRIINRAKLPRRRFSSACEDLGLSSTAQQCLGEINVVDGNDNQEPNKRITPIGDVVLPIGTDGTRGMPVFFLDAKGPGGTTALALATVQNDPEAVRQLLQAGADPSVESKSGHTALTWAAVCGFELVAAELLCHHGTGTGGEGEMIGSLTWVTRKESKTALHNAASNGAAGVAMLRLDRLRDMLLKNSFGTRKESDESVGPGIGWFHPFREFVRRQDCRGCTALDLAKQAGHEEVVSILDNAEGRIEEWEACQRAQEYAAQRIECGNDNCQHRDRRDRIERHETFECLRRPAGCPACGLKLPAEGLEAHEENECDKRRAVCPNAMKGCYDVVPHDRLAAHMAHMCKFRRVECRRRCGATIAASLLEEHEQEHCRLSKHPCVLGCGEQTTKTGMAAHIKKDCSRRKVRCSLGCRSEVEAQRLLHHEEEICTRACCWEGCGERIGPASRRDAHERYLCRHRPAECAHGCGTRGLSAGLKTAHELHHCCLRPIPCPHGCGASLPSNQLPAHVRAEGGACPERPQRCRYDCLRRRILVATEPTTEEEEKRAAEANGRLVVPGMLRLYDTSSGVFGIRYPDGNRQEALENLDFVWADEGSTLSNGRGGGGGGDEATSTGAWECGWVTASDMDDHLQNSCPRRMAPCRDGCGQSLVVREAELHYERGCPKRYVACNLGCGVEVRHENLFTHTDEECSLRSVTCEACGRQVPLKDMEEHLNERCPKAPKRCTNGCGSLVRGEELPRHLESECPKRIVPCPLGCPEPELWSEEVESHLTNQCPLHREPCRKGCGEELSACSREAHEGFECVERIVRCECGTEHKFSRTEDHRVMECRAVVCYCSLGCGVKVRKMDMDRHQDEDCERKTLRSLSKMIECSLKCGHLILRQWEFQHCVFDCPKRPMRCPGGCSADIPASDVHTHYKTCGRRRIRCGTGSEGCERMLLTWVGLTEVTRKEKEGFLSPVAYSQQGPRQGLSNGMIPCSEHGSDALMWAAGKGDVERALLEELLTLTGGAGINRESHLGDTALTIACARGHVESARILIKLGRADMNHETRSGKTALIEAARHGRTEVVRLLMTLRAVISYTNRRGQTAAWWAARLGHQQCLVPIEREVTAEATLRLVSSQIARGDVEAVRSLVELGEPYRDNHCGQLEDEIDRVTVELEQAKKRIRDVSAAREELAPALEQLQASLQADLEKRRKIQEDAAQGARSNSARTASGGKKRKSGNEHETTLSTVVVNVTARSFEAMQVRALRAFQRSAACLQALTDEDFRRVAELEALSGLSADGLADNSATCLETNAASASECDQDRSRRWDGEGEADPTPSLSVTADRRAEPRQDWNEKKMEQKDYVGDGGDIHCDRDSGVCDAEAADASGRRNVDNKQEYAGATIVPEEEVTGENHARAAAASVLRVLRATVVILGGCGLGSLPSDRDLWRAMREMLLDGSLRHRVRHFDRRAVPPGVMDGVRALLTIDNSFNQGHKIPVTRKAPVSTAPDAEQGGDGYIVGTDTMAASTETTTVHTINHEKNALTIFEAVRGNSGGLGDDGTAEVCDVGVNLNVTSSGNLGNQIRDAEGGNSTDSDGEDDGPDPWREGVGEAGWGKGIGEVSSRNGDGRRLALVEALGSWCASVSSYDRLVRPTPGSTAGRAAAAAMEWGELERRIARTKLDVQLEEFSFQLLSTEISDATNAAKYLSQKRAWGEDRLAVARALSLVSPTGHSLVSWAAACGQTEVVEVLMDHGATAGPGDEIRAVSASILQAFYRYRRWVWQQASSRAADGVETGLAAAEGGQAMLKRRMEHAVELLGKHLALARLRRTRRLPLIEAAYNGHHEVLQFFRMRRLQLYAAARTWLYPSAPPPFAPLGDGTISNHVLNDGPMSVADCAEAGLRDRGCKQRIPGKGWVGEWDKDNRFAITARKRGELMKRVDAAIENGYLKAPEIVALCQEGVSIDRETASGKTALISAAEEDPRAHGHSWVRNEEGWAVLAVAFLLDRRMHRPKIDHESRVTGYTALTRACTLGRLETAEVLLDRGADVNHTPKWRGSQTPTSRPRPSNGQSRPLPPSAKIRPPVTPGHLVAVAAVRPPPLIAAAAAGHAEMVRLLLEHGADVGVRDGEGRTAADVAREEGFVDVLAALAKREVGNLGIAVGARGAANPLVPCGWGCGRLVITGHDKVNHEEGCAHREVECTNACGAFRLQQWQLERHLAESCRRRPVVCRSRCGVTVPAGDYADHEATSCAMRPVVCEACLSKVVASAITRHKQETCPQRLAACEQGCGESVPLSSMSRHLANTCPLTSVRCRLGCGANMWLKMRAEHESLLCSELTVTCKWGCAEAIKAKHLFEHEKRECCRAEVQCGNRCGQTVPVADMKTHYAEACPHRFVPCAAGCGYKIRAKDLVHHEAKECQSRVIMCPQGCGAGPFPARASEVHLKYDCTFRRMTCAMCGVEICAGEIDLHKSNACRRRSIACCNQGCWLRLPADDMEVHEARECPRRIVWCLQANNIVIKCDDGL